MSDQHTISATIGRVYAKALIPPSLAILLVDGPSPDAPLWAQLTAAGWVRGEDAGTDVDVEVSIRVSPTEESLVIRNKQYEILRDEQNPWAPEGWWDAVDSNSGLGVVILVEPGYSLGGTPEQVAAAYNAARTAGHTLSALAQVHN